MIHQKYRLIKMKSESIIVDLIIAVEKHFSFLKVLGFRILVESAKVSPTVVELEIVASRIAFLLSVDLRDGATNCYITQSVEGRAAKMGDGYHFERLTSFLRRKRIVWKDKIPEDLSIIPSELPQRLRRDIQIYAMMVQIAAAYSEGDPNHLTF